MVRRDDFHRIEWPLGKITWIFSDHDGVICTVEVEGGQRSTRSVAFIVLLKLDSKEADTATQTDERDNSYVEREGVVTDQPPSPVPSNHPDESADRQSSPVSNNEGGSLQRDRVPPPKAQTF